MNLELLDIKNRCLTQLKDAGYTKLEEVLTLPEQTLLHILSYDEKLLLDFKECTYCYFCPESYFRNGTCYENVIHRGRFISTFRNFSCSKHPNIKNAAQINTLFSFTPREDTPPSIKEADTSLPSGTALFELCRTLFINGTLLKSHPAYFPTLLLLELEGMFSKKDFARILISSEHILSECLTQQNPDIQKENY